MYLPLILGTKKRQLTDAETVKECMLASIEEVVTDEKTQNSVIDSIKNIPIFDMTTSMRVETLASDVFGTLLDQLKKAKVMLLSVDGSTDSNVAQLSCFREELLGLIPMDGHTTIEILLEKVITFFRENQLEMDCVNMLVMNSVPAMSTYFWTDW